MALWAIYLVMVPGGAIAGFINKQIGLHCTGVEWMLVQFLVFYGIVSLVLSRRRPA